MLEAAALVFALTARPWTLDAGLPSRLSAAELARGKALYEAFCQRCHGPDGDDTRSEGITPLAGLSLRLGDPRNRNFGGPAFRARGRVYVPEEASVLMGYILTLRGEKGFPRPEALVSPCLLDRKRARRTYVVLDVRPEAEYRKAHVANAASVPPQRFSALRWPRLSPALRGRVVIVYDEGSGRQAARVWRALHAAGHRTVAVLDGGFRRWVAEDREVTPAVSASLPRPILVESGEDGPVETPPASGPTRRLQLDCRRTVDERGVLPAAQLSSALQEGGFQGPGRYRLQPEGECADLLALQLHLLGYSAEPVTPAELVVR